MWVWIQDFLKGLVDRGKGIFANNSPDNVVNVLVEVSALRVFLVFTLYVTSRPTMSCTDTLLDLCLFCQKELRMAGQFRAIVCEHNTVLSFNADKPQYLQTTVFIKTYCMQFHSKRQSHVTVETQFDQLEAKPV